MGADQGEPAGPGRDRAPGPAWPADPPDPPARPGAADVLLLRGAYVSPLTLRRPPPRRLPPAAGDFVGRGGQLAALEAAVPDPSVAREPVTVAIHGPAGVGKTALALHWAHRIRDRYPDGQLFVDLRGRCGEHRMSPPEAFAALLRGLGLPADQIPCAVEEMAALYRATLASRRVLIVFDDAATSEQVRPVLPGSPSCLTVVTSRGYLSGLVARERARAAPLDALTGAESLHLVRSVAGAERVDGDPATAELVRRCARLPLALRVAATALAARPDEPLAALAADLAAARSSGRGGRAEPDPASAIRGALGAAYGRLPEIDRRALRRIALHRGPSLVLGDVAALLGATDEVAGEVLDRLVRGAMMVETQPGRLRLPDQVRDFVHGRTVGDAGGDAGGADAGGESPDDVAAARRLIEARLERVRQAAELSEPAQAAWLETEATDIVACVRQAAELGWHDQAWRLAEAAFDPLTRHRYHRESVDAQGVGLRSAQAVGDVAAQARLAYHLAVGYGAIGDLDAALAAADLACGVAVLAGDRVALARARGEFARIRYALGDYAGAATAAETALELWRECGDRPGEADVLDLLTRAAHRDGRYPDALAYGRQALEIRTELADQRARAHTLDLLARVQRGRGQHAEALGLLGQALRIWVRIGDRRGEGEALGGLAIVYRRLSRYREAHEHCLRSLAIRREIGDRRGEAAELDNLGRIHRLVGVYPEALRHAGEALEIRRALGDRRGEAESLENLARIHCRIGRRREALRHAEEALALRRALDDQYGEGTTLEALAEVFHEMGRQTTALECASRSLAVRQRIGDRYGVARALHTLGVVHERLGRRAEAYGCLTRALPILDEVAPPEAAQVRELLAILGRPSEPSELLAEGG